MKHDVSGNSMILLEREIVSAVTNNNCSNILKYFDYKNSLVNGEVATVVGISRVINLLNKNLYIVKNGAGKIYINGDGGNNNLTFNSVSLNNSSRKILEFNYEMIDKKKIIITNLNLPKEEPIQRIIMNTKIIYGSNFIRKILNGTG